MQLADECIEAEGCPKLGREAPNDSLGVLDTVLFGGVDMKGPPRLASSPPELTRAYTSIIASKILYLDPSSATNLGLDMCYSQEELDSERQRALERVYRVLPSKADSLQLIKVVRFLRLYTSPSAQQTDLSSLPQYFAQFEWFFAMLHQDSFFAEVDRFWEMVEGGRKYEVDPAWLAMFYLVRTLLSLALNAAHLPLPQVLALASDDSLHMSFASPLSHNEDWVEKGRTLQAAAQRLMYLSDCMGRPQVRVIQFVFSFLLLSSAHVLSSQLSQMHSATRLRASPLRPHASLHLLTFPLDAVDAHFGAVRYSSLYFTSSQTDSTFSPEVEITVASRHGSLVPSELVRSLACID